MESSDIHVFTLLLFQNAKGDSLFRRHFYYEQMLKVFPQGVKIYTEQDEIVREALSIGKPWIDSCLKVNSYFYNFASDIVKFYILNKVPNSLYIDADVWLLSNPLEHMDLSSNYCELSNGEGMLSLIYNNSQVGQYTEIINILNERAQNVKSIEDFIMDCYNPPVFDLMAQFNSYKTFRNGDFFHTNSCWKVITDNIKEIKICKPSNFSYKAFNDFAYEKDIGYIILHDIKSRELIMNKLPNVIGVYNFENVQDVLIKEIEFRNIPITIEENFTF